MKEQLGAIIDGFRTKKWPWIVSILLLLFIVGSMLFLVGSRLTDNVEQVAAEVIASSSANSAATKSSRATAEDSGEKTEDKNINEGERKDVITPQADNDTGQQVDSAPPQNKPGPENSKPNPLPAFTPKPIPPRPQGINISSGLLVGTHISAGQYMILNCYGELKITQNNNTIVHQEFCNGRSSILSLNQGQAIGAGIGKAYTLAEIEIIDQYYNGIG